MTRRQHRHRRQSRTRAVGFQLTFRGIDCEGVERVLRQAAVGGIVTEWDYTVSADHQHNILWFNGAPGAALREVMRRVCEHLTNEKRQRSHS